MDYSPLSGDRLRSVSSDEFFERMAERVKLQAPGAYHLNGESPEMVNNMTFHERMEMADNKLNAAIQELGIDKGTIEKVNDILIDYTCIVMDLYFEIGIKIGLRLKAQPIGGFKTDYQGKLETNYISDMFRRADTQHIRSFLMSGEEVDEWGTEPYSEQVNKACKYLTAFFEYRFRDTGQLNEIMKHVVEHLIELQDIHLEVGLQLGMQLGSQLFSPISTHV